MDSIRADLGHQAGDVEAKLKTFLEGFAKSFAA